MGKLSGRSCNAAIACVAIAANGQSSSPSWPSSILYAEEIKGDTTDQYQVNKKTVISLCMLYYCFFYPLVLLVTLYSKGTQSYKRSEWWMLMIVNESLISNCWLCDYR